MLYVVYVVNFFFNVVSCKFQFYWGYNPNKIEILFLKYIINTTTTTTTTTTSKMTKQIQTLKTMVDTSNMIITTMANEFKSCITDEDNAGDISSYLYKEIDGLHYYIHGCITQYEDDYMPRITKYAVIRTNYKIKNSKPRGHPKTGFYGFMKYCMGDLDRDIYTEEKITDLNGKYQWYDRYENQNKKDYKMGFELKQSLYDVMENREMPYGYKLEIFCGKPYLMYDGPELLSIPHKQFYLTVKDILQNLQKPQQN